jgi:CARDB
MKPYLASLAQRARLAFALFALASLSLINPALSATLVDIATDVTDPSNLADTEPSIAVDPTDPLKIAVVSFSGNWGISVTGTPIMAPVWKSNDGGLTWRKVPQIPQPKPGLSGPGDQKIAFDADGKLYIAELGFSPAQDFVFRQTVGPDAPFTPGAAFGDDQPHLDVDKAAGGGCLNRLYSPWLNFGVARERSTISNSTNQGMTLSDVAVGDNTSFPNRTTRIALASDGKAYAVYKTREGAAGANFESAHFRVARSDNCGGSWDGLGPGGVSVHGANPVQTFFTTSFGNPAKGKVARARSSDAWIAADPSSRDVYVAYINRDASGFGQVYVARSTDQGLTWNSHRVTDGTHHSAYPEIAVADNGAIGVLYIDFDDSSDRTIFRHRFARSFDQGVSWNDEILQSMDPTPLANAANGFLWGDYEGLTGLGTFFYGVFTGQSINRSIPQLDPIFFTETAGRPGAPIAQYAAKFVCGKSDGTVVAPGIYFTAINVHSPSSRPVFLRKKVAIALPGEHPGPTTQFVQARLRPDEAFEIDCPDIMRFARAQGFIKGFVVIETDVELDVVAVYSAAGATRQVETMELERVPPRRLGSPGKPDLVPVNPNPQQGPVGFCQGKEGKLVVTVKNQGAADADTSTTTVAFANAQPASQPTPPIAAGGATDLSFEIPGACFKPDCAFKITADSGSQVDESDESNNTADGRCPG